MSNPTCTIPECVKPARSATAELCPMHYHRKYRHGNTDLVSVGKDAGTRKPRNYRMKYIPTHPLAGKNGKAYVHRLVLFEATQGTDVTCHWCHTPLDWSEGKSSPLCIHVDHLNGVTDDNTPENLAPSCRTCNVARGVQERSEALRAMGWWSANDTIASLSKGGRARPIMQDSTS